MVEEEGKDKEPAGTELDVLEVASKCKGLFFYHRTVRPYCLNVLSLLNPYVPYRTVQPYCATLFFSFEHGQLARKKMLEPGWAHVTHTEHETEVAVQLRLVIGSAAGDSDSDSAAGNKRSETKIKCWPAEDEGVVSEELISGMPVLEFGCIMCCKSWRGMVQTCTGRNS
eukprot:352616-Chlamydomonas_euryale.AAC.1